MEDITIVVVSEAVLEEAWKTSNEKVRIQKFSTSEVTDEEYENLKKAIEVMTTTDDYAAYKKEFDKVCRYCHIVPRGVIIHSYRLVRNKNAGGKHTFYLGYSYNTKQITLDDDTVLYHISSVAGLTELKPYFRGKATKGYLYDKHRIYFTVRKNLPKIFADYNKGGKMHTYMCTKKINKVFVDPLLRDKYSRAVYVETTSPIPVKEIDTSMLQALKDKMSKTDEISNKDKGMLFDTRFL